MVALLTVGVKRASVLLAGVSYDGWVNALCSQRRRRLLVQWTVCFWYVYGTCVGLGDSYDVRDKLCRCHVVVFVFDVFIMAQVEWSCQGNG